MVKAPASTKTLYRAKHTLEAFTTIEKTNAISPIITSKSSPQWVYWSSIQFHPTTKTNTRYNLPTTKL
jgi:hypothetical protein